MAAGTTSAKSTTLRNRKVKNAETSADPDVPSKLNDSPELKGNAPRTKEKFSPKLPRASFVSRGTLLALLLGITLGLLLPRLRHLSPVKLEGAIENEEADENEDEEEEIDFTGYARYTDPSDQVFGDEDLFVRVVNESQPVLQSMDNAMPEDEFEKLQECLRDHPMRHSNVNNEDTFGLTRGFIVSFNEDGAEEFEKHPHFECLAPYWRRHRHPMSNAWIVNMVWADIPDYTKEFSIERHTDDALELEYPGDRKVMPYQTNVLYVFVPEDMKGGEIEAFPYHSTEEDFMKPTPYKVTPVENRMACFRGDSWHQVRSYTTSSNKVLRGSLVLENYAIPLNLRQHVVRFTWSDRDNTEMM